MKKETRAQEFKRKKKIHISDLSRYPCDRLLALLYSGQWQEIRTPEEELRMRIGTVIHEMEAKMEEEEAKEKGYILFVEEELETPHLTGRADRIRVFPDKGVIQIIDLKTMNCKLFSHFVVRPEMAKQVVLYKAMICYRKQKFFKKLKKMGIEKDDWEVECYIRPFCKCGIPSHYKNPKDYPVNADPKEAYEEAERRAINIIKALKSGGLPEKNPIYCNGCPARRACEGRKEVVL